MDVRGRELQRLEPAVREAVDRARMLIELDRARTQIEAPHAHAGGAQHEREALLAIAQRFVELPLFGDVARDQRERDRRSADRRDPALVARIWAARARAVAGEAIGATGLQHAFDRVA